PSWVLPYRVDGCGFGKGSLSEYGPQGIATHQYSPNSGGRPKTAEFCQPAATNQEKGGSDAEYPGPKDAILRRRVTAQFPQNWRILLRGRLADVGGHSSGRGPTRFIQPAQGTD